MVEAKSSNGTFNKVLIDSLIHTAKTCGLDGLTPVEMDGLIAALAEKIEADLRLTPPINPDRRYKLKELKPLGYERGRLYKAHQNVIRKDGRKSYVLGRDLLALNDAAPTLAMSPAPTTRRPRGRPRKIVMADTQP
jgi:hypothetical protein